MFFHIFKCHDEDASFHQEISAHTRPRVNVRHPYVGPRFDFELFVVFVLN